MDTKEQKWCVYKHTNLVNEKVYIGQTCQIPEKRWGDGINQYRHNSHFVAAIKKYGWQNFKHEILIENLTEEEVLFWEDYYINYYDSLNPQKGYNKVKGGQKSPFTQLWKDPAFRKVQSDRQSIFMIQKYKDPKQREKLSQKIKQYWDNHPQVKIQQNKRFSQTLKRLWQNEQYRDKQSQKLKQYIKEHNKEHKAQCKINAEKNWNNPDYRKKMCKAIKNVETGLIFESAAAAARWCGLADRSSITKYLTQHTRSAGKHPETKIPLHWEYVNESEVVEKCGVLEQR